MCCARLCCSALYIPSLLRIEAQGSDLHLESRDKYLREIVTPYERGARVALSLSRETWGIEGAAEEVGCRAGSTYW